jgi:hypothetical protein
MRGLHPSVKQHVKELFNPFYFLTHLAPERGFKTNKLPKQPPTLLEATKWLAQMGGYLGRKSDGPPGLKTVWLGYESLLQAVALYEVLKNLGKD